MILLTHLPSFLTMISFFTASLLFAQEPGGITAERAADSTRKIVVITGARFSYQLIEKWIDDYNKLKPEVQIIIESRGSNDPRKYDILAEVYRHPEEIRSNRLYLNIGRYAILPVATSNSPFAKLYVEKGLNKERIIDVFFHDVFTEKRKQKNDVSFTPYTRLQKAGAPSVFANYFGFQQKDLKGNAIAGADTHLLKAVLRDPIGVTYLPLPLIYDYESRIPANGLTVLPVDLSGNGKISEEEKFYGNLDTVIDKLEKTDPADIKNIPVEYFHLSVDRERATTEAIDFLKWVKDNGQRDLREFGYLKPDPKHLDNERFDEFTAERY